MLSGSAFTIAPLLVYISQNFNRRISLKPVPTRVLEHRIILFLLKQLWHSSVNLCKKILPGHFHYLTVQLLANMEVFQPKRVVATVDKTTICSSFLTMFQMCLNQKCFN